MASTYSPLLRLENQTTGENDDTWGDIEVATRNLTEKAIVGYLQKDVAGGSEVTLSTNNGIEDEARYRFIEFTGILTANINVIFPDDGRWMVKNSTTGVNFTLTCKTSAGTGITIARKAVLPIAGDGTNIIAEAPFTTSATAVVFNEDGNDTDFRIEGDTDVNLFVLNAGLDAIGIGTDTPESGAKLDVNGVLKADTLRLDNGSFLQGEVIAGGSYQSLIGLSTGDNTLIRTSGLLNIQDTDASNAVLAQFQGAASAVNYVELRNSVTTGPVEVNAQGSDTNIGIDLQPKGSGEVLDNGSPLQPVGNITEYAGASAPTGWLLCDGQAVSRSTYDDLFALIGTTYGVGNGSTTFNLPDLSPFTTVSKYIKT